MKKIIFFLIVFLQLSFGVNFIPSLMAYEAKEIPWSGHWWPFTKGELVNGYEANQKSPLEKYDMMKSGISSGPAVSFGRINFYHPSNQYWTGLCFNWAMSSILEEEPKNRSVHNDVIFNVGDKKGILAAFYYNAIYETYSVKNPEDFHAILKTNIAYQNNSLIMDLGSADEVWTYPVFKYETQYNQTGNIRHYETTVFYAKYSKPDQTGTRVGDRKFFYYFQLDGNVIVGSGWEGSSIQQPPKKAFIPIGRRPLSDSFDFDADLIHEISDSTDDPFKGNDSFDTASPIISGGHTLLALNADFFKIHLENHDKLNIQLIPEISESVVLTIYNPEQKLVEEFINGNYLIFQPEESGVHYLKVEPSGNEEAPAYALHVLQILSYQSLFPLDPSGNWINGLALLQPNPGHGRVIMSRIGESGLPYKGNLIDNFSVRRIGICEEFNLSSTREGYIRVDSDLPIVGMQAVISGKYYLKGNNILSFKRASAELFFPHLAVSLYGGWQTSIGLINVFEQPEEILLKGYGPDGSVLVSETVNLNPGEKKEIDIYNSFLNNAASVSATVHSGRNCLLGYVEFTNYSLSMQGCCSIPAVSTQERGALLVAPIGSSNGDWHSGIAVMNTGNETTTVCFSALDSLGENVQNVSQILKPKQKLAKTLWSLFPGVVVENISSIRIESQNGQLLTGLGLYNSDLGMQLAGIPLLPPSEHTFYIPHIAEGNNWWTGVGLINAGEEEGSVSLFLYDDSGTLLNSVEKSLLSGERLNCPIRTLFAPEMIKSSGYMKITSHEGNPLSAVYLVGTEDGYKLMGDVLAR